MPIKTKYLFILLNAFFLKEGLLAQAFKMGDVVFNANYGAPNLAAAIIKWQDFNPSRYEYFLGPPKYVVSNTNIYSIKAEYAINNKFGLGFSSAYWSMDVEETFRSGEHRMASLQNVHTYKYKYHLSFLSYAIRANYHFRQTKRIDAYLGAGMGLTKQVSTYQYFPDFPNTPEFGRKKYESGIIPHFNASFGARYYIFPFLGLNLEVGYDTGALFLGGIVFKLSTKKKEHAE